MRFVGGYQDTRRNDEDMAITPYLFGVYLNTPRIKIYGLGLCWGWKAVYLGIGIGIPAGFPLFTNNTKEEV